MSKIAIIGAGAMGSAFTFPCIENKHEVYIVIKLTQNAHTK